MTGTSPLFWTLWGMSAATVVAILWGAFIAPRRLLHLPVLTAAMWGYFYVYLAHGTATTLAQYVSDWALELGQLMALLCLWALFLGWERAWFRSGELTAPSDDYDWERVRALGMALVVAGAVANASFMAREEIDWEGSSAYLYLLFHIGYPGLALYLAGMLKGGRAGRKQWFVFAALVVITVVEHVSRARRGPLFPAVIVLLLVPSLVRASVPGRIRFFGGLLAAGALMLMFVAVRPWIYSEGDRSALWQEALAELSTDAVLSARARTFDDNEYILHCGQLATNFELGLYQYGTGFLGLCLHWVPRALWPSKPTLGAGWFEEAAPRMHEVMGWEMTVGAASGGVASTFNQFGLFCPLFWFLLGRLLSRLYLRASTAGSLPALLVYVGICASLHWAVSQGIDAAFVPACIYIATPLLVLRLCRRRGLRELRTGELPGPSCLETGRAL